MQALLQPHVAFYFENFLCCLSYHGILLYHELKHIIVSKLSFSTIQFSIINTIFDIEFMLKFILKRYSIKNDITSVHAPAHMHSHTSEYLR